MNKILLKERRGQERLFVVVVKMLIVQYVSH